MPKLTVCNLWLLSFTVMVNVNKHAILKVIFHCYNLILKLQYSISLHHMSETSLKLYIAFDMYVPAQSGFGSYIYVYVVNHLYSTIA